MDDGKWTMIYLSLWMGLYFLYISVSLQIATLALNMLSTVAADDASQTTLVQITYVFVFCVLFYIN